MLSLALLLSKVCFNTMHFYRAAGTVYFLKIPPPCPSTEHKGSELPASLRHSKFNVFLV